MLNWIGFTRIIAIVLVGAMMVGALVLIGIGCYYILSAIAELIGLGFVPTSAPWAIAAKLAILKAVDSFVFAIVLIYLGFGVYFLASASPDAKVPSWLEIKSVADMERKVLEVIVVLVAILFLQTLVEQAVELSWLALIYPAAIIAISIALKLIPFKH